MRHGSLFSGIGGFDLAAEWMGWENKFHCEWNEFGQKVLHHYWPDAECFTDITKSDFKKYYGKIDILTGGFPCQPYSSAGKRKGKDDERHLWPEMLRAIREVSPRFVVGENVRGLTNWNGGLVFEEVCAELESYGYQVAPVIIPACAVGAPHKRERIWFVAQNTMRSGLLQRESIEKGAEVWQQRNTSTGSSDRVYISEGITANADNPRLQAQHNKKPLMGKANRTKTPCGNSVESVYTRQGWDAFPTQSPVCSGDDGFSTELDGITFSKWRNESIKAYGNAIVPQVAYQIFKAIQLTNENTRRKN
jgi:DNA (cytosine-5)-methyltransferase 1